MRTLALPLSLAPPRSLAGCEAKPVGTFDRAAVRRRRRPGAARPLLRPRRGCAGARRGRAAGRVPADAGARTPRTTCSSTSAAPSSPVLERAAARDPAAHLRRHPHPGAGPAGAAPRLRRLRQPWTDVGAGAGAALRTHHGRVPGEQALAGRADHAAAAARLHQRAQPRQHGRRAARPDRARAVSRLATGVIGADAVHPLPRGQGEGHPQPIDTGTEPWPRQHAPPRAAWSSTPTTTSASRSPPTSPTTARQAAAQAVAAQRGWSTTNIRKGGLAAALRLLGVAPPARFMIVDIEGLPIEEVEVGADRTRPARLGGDGARHASTTSTTSAASCAPAPATT